MDKIKEKICPGCGGKFKTNDNRVKYCSDECRESTTLIKIKKCQKSKNKQRDITKKCCICDAEFVDTTRNHCKNTCSERCAKEKRRINYIKWKNENPESYKESQKRSIARKKRTGYWRKYRIKKALLAKRKK